MYNLPIYLRRFYIRKLVDIRSKENEQVENAQASAKSKSPGGGMPSKSNMPSKFR